MACRARLLSAGNARTSSTRGVGSDNMSVWLDLGDSALSGIYPTGSSVDEPRR
jgi:hypothetical protein